MWWDHGDCLAQKRYTRNYNQTTLPKWLGSLFFFSFSLDSFSKDFRVPISFAATGGLRHMIKPFSCRICIMRSCAISIGSVSHTTL